MARRQRRTEQQPFAADRPDAVLAQMERLAAAGDGWINLVLLSGEDDQPTALGFMTVFGGGGPGLQMCTWTPGRLEDGRPGAATLGIAHLAGRRIAAELASLGVAVPSSWRVAQDHPKRGLVLRVPAAEDHRGLLDWALRAAGALAGAATAGGGAAGAPGAPSPRASTAPRWRADVYFPAGS